MYHKEIAENKIKKTQEIKINTRFDLKIFT